MSTPSRTRINAARRTTALVALAVVAFFAAEVDAAVPATVGVVGTLRTQGGGPITDGSYTLTFALYPTGTAAKPVWQETGSVKVLAGRFSWALGSAKALNITDLDAAKAAWLGVRVGLEKELPRVALRAVLFARRAQRADSAKSADTAKLADAAKAAQTAKTADIAKSAESAKNAELAKTAAVAKGLDCTGCVGVAALKFDKDIDLGKRTLKADKINVGALTAGSVLATSVAASTVSGDGS